MAAASLLTLCCMTSASAADSGWMAHALKASATVDHERKIFRYAVKNLEPPGSGSFVYEFTLDISARVVAIEDPKGWTHHTDGHSVVIWYPKNHHPPVIDFPNPSAIPPGAELIGFAIKTDASTSERQLYHISSLNAAGLNGPALDGFIEAPLDPAQPQDGL